LDLYISTKIRYGSGRIYTYINVNYICIYIWLYLIKLLRWSIDDKFLFFFVSFFLNFYQYQSIDRRNRNCRHMLCILSYWAPHLYIIFFNIIFYNWLR